MALDLLEVTAPGWAYILLGGFVVAFSLVSLPVKQSLYVNEVVLGTGFGILMGPHVAGIFDPRSWTDNVNALTLEFMRIVLATGLFAIGVELPKSYMAKAAKSLLIMVVPTMTIGWVISAAFIHVLFPQLSYISGLAISACLTPTDPVVSAAIIGGKFATTHVPQDLRRLLIAESASNDGLAYPFLSISIYLTVEASRRAAIGKWFLVGWLYQVILGVVLGALLGFSFSRLMRFAHKRGFVDRESYVAQYIALAIFTIGVTSTLGSDDLLAAFAAGNAFSWDGDFNSQIGNDVFASVVDFVLNCACFIYIGAWLPFDHFNVPALGLSPPRLIALLVLILTLRRIPALLVLYRWVPEIDGWREALFAGHFGPMGVGAVFVSTLAVSRLGTPADPPRTQQDILATTLQPIVAFVLLGSIILIESMTGSFTLSNTSTFINGLSISMFTLGHKIRSRAAILRSNGGADEPEWMRGATAHRHSVTPPLPHAEQGDRGIELVPMPVGTIDPKDACADNTERDVADEGFFVDHGLEHVSPRI